MRPTPRPTPVAAASVLAGGAVATTVAYRDDLDPAVVDVSLGLLPIACATTVLLGVIRRWLNQHEARTTDSVTRLLTQHEIRQEELLARERAVEQTERRVERMAHMHSIRVRSAWKRVDILNGENLELRRRAETLEADHRELTAEYNELVGETLRQRGTVFTQRTTGSATLIPGGDAEQHSRAASAPDGPTARPAAGSEALPAPGRRRGRPTLGLVRQRHDGGKAKRM